MGAEDLLKKQLETTEDQEGIQQIVEDAKDMGFEDVARLAEEKISAIKAKAESVGTTTSAQVSQVEGMGGSADEVEKRTEAVDQKIEGIVADTGQKIESVTAGSVIPAEAAVSDKRKPVEEVAPIESIAGNSVEKLKLEYRSVLEKIKAAKEKLAKIIEQRTALSREKGDAEGTGDEQKLSELKKKLKENEVERQKVEAGDKLVVNYEQFREQDAILYGELTRLDEERKSLDVKKLGYDKYYATLKDIVSKQEALRAQREALGEEAIKQRRSQLEKWEENGLDSFKQERQKLILEFKKRNGYDETLAREAHEKFGYGAAETDANRQVLNKYLGLELPLISRDLKLKTGDREGKFDVVDDNSPEGTYNTSLLIKKRAELFLKAQEASKAIKELSDEVKAKILEEYALEWDALNEEKIHSGSSDMEPHYQIRILAIFLLHL